MSQKCDYIPLTLHHRHSTTPKYPYTNLSKTLLLWLWLWIVNSKIRKNPTQKKKQIPRALFPFTTNLRRWCVSPIFSFTLFSVFGFGLRLRKCEMRSSTSQGCCLNRWCVLHSQLKTLQYCCCSGLLSVFCWWWRAAWVLRIFICQKNFWWLFCCSTLQWWLWVLRVCGRKDRDDDGFVFIISAVVKNLRLFFVLMSYDCVYKTSVYKVIRDRKRIVFLNIL